MPEAIIYHNPRCSKSRATLALLETKHPDVKIVKYLENPPSEQQIKKIVGLLDVHIRDLLRKNEAEYKEHGFTDLNLSDDELIALVHQYPEVLERPIVIYQDQAIIGRPPENVLSLFE